ncbi:MAG: hypothetical protein CSA62_03120 [Planctomycetota bacterium]|nr:MAG: hypothetical protein CSA62_03120 [Planctomycetota bacterium]
MRFPSFALSLLAATLLLTASAISQGGDFVAKRCFQLILSGNTDAVQVQAAYARPWPYFAPKRELGTRGRIDLLGADGRLVYRVPVELSHFNLHRDQRKGQVLVFGDHVHVPDIELPVKIPDLGSRVVSLRLDLREGLRTRTLCQMQMTDLRRLVQQTTFAAALAAPKVKTIMNNGPVANRYDIVILGDAYQAKEEARFYQDIDKWKKDLFGREPFKSYQKFFNIHSVFRASAESGADQPDKTPPIVKNTAYDATYHYGKTARCLYIRNTKLATQDAALAPDVEGRVVVFVNDSRYGGCAGTFAVSYNGSSGPRVQSHEFGHSFGRLADEYSYGRSGTYSGREPRQANITADSTGKTKWPLWIGYKGVGLFQGGGYYKAGIWRPKSNCLMRSLGAPLCEVCVEQLCKQCYSAVKAIEHPQPNKALLQIMQPNLVQLSFSDLVPGGGEIEWWVGSTLVQKGGTSFAFASAAFSPGYHTVRVVNKDKSAFVRSDPKGLLSSDHFWVIQVKAASSTPIGTLPKGMAKREGNTRQDPVFHNSPGRVQYLYLRSLLPYGPGNVTLQGLRLRPDAGMACSTWKADCEIRMSSLGVPVDSPSAADFAKNHGSDLRVVFKRKTLVWPAVPKASATPHPFLQQIKFDAPQRFSGKDLCIDLLGFEKNIAQHAWYADAVKRIDHGSKSIYGKACPIQASYDASGYYVGGKLITQGYTRQAASTTSFALAWIGLQKTQFTLPGTSCSVLTPPVFYYGRPQRMTGNNGFAKFDWGVVPLWLRHQKIYSQMLGLDPSYNSFGLRLTPAVEIRIGADAEMHSVYGFASGSQSFDPSKDKPQQLERGTAAIFELF